MTTKDQQEFKSLIKEGTLEALESKKGQNAIVGAMNSLEGQNAIVGAMNSLEGQNAIVGAMNSLEGQNAIKRGSLAALKSDEGKEILVDSFVESFHDVVVPSLDNISKDINGLKVDVACLKESAVKREELTEMIKRKMRGVAS